MDNLLRIPIVRIALGFLLLLMAFFSTYTVRAGEKAIVFTFGKISSVSDSGLHFKIPLVQSIERVDVRTRKAHAPASAGTNDLQSVKTEVALNYHLNEKSLVDIYSKFGLQVEDKIVDPRIQEVVKAVVARFSAEELLKKRDTVKDEIAVGLRALLAPYEVVVEDIQITDFSFSESFDVAIEAKQTAEQNALKAKNDLTRIEVEAKQRIVTATAEAQAIQIQAEAIRAQGGSEYVRLKAIEKWDGKLPSVNGGAVPFINVAQ